MHGATFLLAAVASLLEAGRRSSDAVLTVLDRTVRDIDPEVDCVLVFAPVADQLACIYASGARAEHFARVHVGRDQTGVLPARAAELGCRAAFPGDGSAIIPNDRAALAMPLSDGHGPGHVVYLSSTRERGSREARDAIVRAVECAALPFAIALEREADRADATHDGLTGLLSPRTFRRRLHDELGRTAAQCNRLLSLWFVDTDRFKSVNDRFGHQTGDGVLQAVASLLRAHLDPQLDVAARNGGDEFCALLTGVSKSAAIERAAAFCEAMRRHDFGIGETITASVGVATFPYDAATSSALLEAADGAMYYSKRNGRDRVSFAIDAATYASLRAEADGQPSRSLSRWRSIVGGSCVRSLS